MKLCRISSVIIMLSFVASIAVLTSCGGSASRQSGTPLAVEEVDPADIPGGTGDDSGSGDDGQDLPDTSNGELHAIFSGKLGTKISSSSLGIIDPDPTGQDVCSDYDGDGLPNNEEITSNPYVADYPRIVTRISAPITMEIRVSETISSENYSETLEEEDITNTVEKSMDENHYTQANKKTTPVVVKESSSSSESEASEYSLGCIVKQNKKNKKWHLGYTDEEFGIEIGEGTEIDISSAAAEEFSESSSSERTDFQNVNYIDNLDRSGSSINQDTVQSMSKNYKTSTVSSSTFETGPNDGVVRASLYIKNATVNIPVRVSNIYCTLTFKTPAGEFLPVKTFKLRNEDWSEYEQDVYGNEEFGPFTIEIENLNTNEVKTALKNGYMPQIHVISYDLEKVDDSNYNPGVNNLKIVEETAKGRTALIKITGEGIREMYRVPAFNVEEASDGTGSISPGVSLKKALFQIFKDRVGDVETWTSDEGNKELTVYDENLKWMPGAPDSDNHTYSDNTTGNSWSYFETYVKTYLDEYDVEHKIETIKRIGDLSSYNPFSKKDNTMYDANELLTKDEFFKMKYWVVYHNGRYYDGDINDPIWAGERYEIICMDMEDFNTHFETFSYTPLQSQETIEVTTLWNEVSNEGQFARSVYLGKAVRGDAIHLELNLSNNRMLFDPAAFEAGLGFGEVYQEFTDSDEYEDLDNGFAWFNFDYTTDDTEEVKEGIPLDFNHSANGRTNSILVEIEESENAADYDIRIYSPDGTTYDKTIRKSYTDLEKNGGIIAVNRHTVDSSGDLVDAIPEGTYYVDVTARGTVYGVPVTKPSSNNHDGDTTVEGDDVSVTVNNPTDTVAGEFTYTVSSRTNMLTFQISDADNAEYFLVEYTGPQNYGITSVTSEKIHAGYNVIELSNPSDDPVDPGVYEVHVYSIINGDETSVSRTEAGSGQFILVNYERYSDQKTEIPKLSTDYFDQRALDLEVNFNDGSGWYRLKLSSGEAGEDGRTINCLSTNYMVYNQQKFHIYFQPPEGDDYCPYNVFSGGRDEVDIYLRTVAKPEYRYTVWPKKNSNSACNSIEDADRYIYTNVESLGLLPNGDVVQYWMENEETDSSNFEDLVEDKQYTFNYLSTVSDGNFGIVQNDNTEYFFSPAVFKKYSIKSSIEDQMVVDPSTGLAKPTFNAVGTDSSIVISELDYPQEVNFFRIYCIEDDHVGESLDTWGDPVITTENTCTISGLSRYKCYTLCVIANSNGTASQLAYRLIRTATNYIGIPLESPYNYAHGAGYFTDSGYLSTSAGIPLQAGIDYQYNMPLDGDQYGIYGNGAGIWDTEPSGSFMSGKYLRIVHAGYNITSPLDMGIIPLAKELEDINVTPAPIWDENDNVWRPTAYIDPERRAFVLPRPSYMRLSAADAVNPIIGSVESYSGSWIAAYTGWGLLFESSFSVHSDSASSEQATINHKSSWPDKGTISTWIYSTSAFILQGGDSQRGYVSIGSSNVIRVLKDSALATYFYYTRIQVRVLNSTVYLSSDIPGGTNNHVYIIWDKDGQDIGDGKTWEVFIDNNPVASGTNDISSVLSENNIIESIYALGCFPISPPYGETVSASQAFKLWDSVVSPTPDWIFDYESNGGDDYRYALHPIYGPLYGYKPALDSSATPAGGIGCFYIPQW
ncbi:MAG: hypothetical protein JW864_04265 [Spirochaetes bacterium]|nr:hypothetical protein [Spirochaetota bacterium]